MKRQSCFQFNLSHLKDIESDTEDIKALSHASTILECRSVGAQPINYILMHILFTICINDLDRQSKVHRDLALCCLSTRLRTKNNISLFTASDRDNHRVNWCSTLLRSRMDR